MKTTFTLQDLLSISKQKWLDYVEKHATEDVIADMYNWHDKYGTPHEYNNRDGYRIAPDGFGILTLSFREGKIYSYDITRFEEGKDEYIFERIMQDMNTLVRNLFKLNLDNPLAIATKVTEMLNELINHKE